jgi:hypothetical protein
LFLKLLESFVNHFEVDWLILVDNTQLLHGDHLQHLMSSGKKKCKIINGKTGIFTFNIKFSIFTDFLNHTQVETILSM